MTYDSKKKEVCLFGGANEAEVLNDLWVLKNNTWQLVQTRKKPQARTFANLTYDPLADRLILFGGNKVLFGTGEEKDILLDDTWEFRDNDWHQMTTNRAPCPRAEAAMVYDENKKRIVLFGGYAIDKDGEYIKLSDTWEFYDNQWHLASEIGPSGRHGAAMIYDIVQKSVVIFGGSTTDKQYGAGTGETWCWDGVEWKKFVASQPRGIFNAAASIDEEYNFIRFGGWDGSNRTDETWKLMNGQWQLVPLTSSPSPRNHSGMAFESHKKRIVLFGGHNGTHVFGDTWVFSKGKWKKLINSKPLERVDNGH